VHLRRTPINVSGSGCSGATTVHGSIAQATVSPGRGETGPGRGARRARGLGRTGSGGEGQREQGERGRVLRGGWGWGWELLLYGPHIQH
jgi:hypothetical protein